MKIIFFIFSCLSLTILTVTNPKKIDYGSFNLERE